MDKDLIAVRSEGTVELRATPAAADHLSAWSLDKQATALHEAGHVVVGAVLGLRPKAADIKGKRGGHTDLSTDDDDRPGVYALANIRNEITVALAGLAATEVVLGYRLSGSHSDVREATHRALDAIAQGVDPDGPLISPSHLPFDMRVPGLAQEVIDHAKALLAAGWDDSRRICEEHREAIVSFASILYERRRLTDRDLDEALAEAGL